MTDQNTSPTGIDDIVALAGSQQNVADQCGVSQQAVQQWVARGFVPLGRAVELEAQYGVPRERLVDPRITGLLG